MRTALRRPPIAVLLCGLAILPAAGLLGCGGGGGERDAEALLDRAFGEPVKSANVEIDAELEVDGLRGLEDPVAIRATGPYIGAEETLPKLDLDVEISAQGVGESIQSGLLSTGDRVFLKFGGAFFEQERSQVAETNKRLAREGGEGGGSLSDLGLDPRSWIVDATVEGEEEVGGVTTEHVTGKLDVGALMSDLNDLVEQSAGALGGEGQAPEPLGDDELERLASAVESPSFDVYVGKDDDVVRRISIRLDVDVPEDDRRDVGGVTGAQVRFSAELSDVGGNQKVAAPRTSQPLSVLTSQLGGLGALTGAGGLGGPGGDTTAPEDSTGDATTDGDGAGVDDFERYSDCLEQASPDDTDAISRCAQLVN